MTTQETHFYLRLHISYGNSSYILWHIKCTQSNNCCTGHCRLAPVSMGPEFSIEPTECNHSVEQFSFRVYTKLTNSNSLTFPGVPEPVFRLQKIFESCIYCNPRFSICTPQRTFFGISDIRSSVDWTFRSLFNSWEISLKCFHKIPWPFPKLSSLNQIYWLYQGLKNYFQVGTHPGSTL